jgi:hypothetical protein
MPTAIRNFVADRDRGPVVATVAEGCASDDGAASPCVDEATRAHRKTSTQRHPENTLRARRSCHFPRTTRAVERNARMPWWPRTVSSSARDRRMVPGTGDGLGAARLRRAPTPADLSPYCPGSRCDPGVLPGLAPRHPLLEHRAHAAGRKRAPRNSGRAKPRVPNFSLRRSRSTRRRRPDRACRRVPRDRRP